MRVRPRRGAAPDRRRRPCSVTSRIVADLIAEDFLERADQGVRVGIRLFELGELAQRSQELRQLALGTMADLRQATGLTVQLGV
ncbi:hypothetical protein ACPCI0_16430 [Streptomyces griseoincarnatus]